MKEYYYEDKNGKEITAGMVIRFSDGSIETVYECEDAWGFPDIGISATNELFLKHHPDWEREYYPLSNWSSKEIEIVNEA